MAKRLDISPQGAQPLPNAGTAPEHSSFDAHVRTVIPRLSEPMHQKAMWLILEGDPQTRNEADLAVEIAALFNLSLEQARRLATDAAEALLAADSSIEHWWHSRLDLRQPAVPPLLP